MGERRTREIGVRKVLGASVSNIWLLLSKDFAMPVLLSSLIACPIAYYTHNWLAGYAVRTNLPWWVFAITGASALLVTIATVSYQSIKSALVNPVKNPKRE